MSGVALTNNAIPVTMKDTAYILDQGSDGSTAVYYLKPGTSPGLNTLAIKGPGPRFNTLLSATALDTRIVTYSSFNKLSPTFNSLDTTTGTWSGPGLNASSNGGNPSISSGSLPSSSNSAIGSSGGDSKSSPSLGVIIGGVVGGLLVIALLAFLFIWTRRQKNAVPIEPRPVDAHINTNTNNYQGPNQYGGSTQMQQNYYQHQQPQIYDKQQQSYTQQQHQPQLYDQQQQYLYQQQQQQQQQQEFYQTPQQQSYNNLNLNARLSSEHSVGSPANSNTIYSVTNSTGAEYLTSPTTAATPITAPLTLSTQALSELQQLYRSPPANPQYNPNTQK
ncbi:hypothetical protein BGZ96_005398 [Linnemannia gamsii]|uniref:Uncharacterized protein n=1 Tax=Linnemannia gamsii TaxID=64522 RepID=A0ABQ7K4V4_9FUNG|nr:hypothetical protein BGZ96_005398 [Linnemannia gamsii]